MSTDSSVITLSELQRLILIAVHQLNNNVSVSDIRCCFSNKALTNIAYITLKTQTSRLENMGLLTSIFDERLNKHRYSITPLGLSIVKKSLKPINKLINADVSLVLIKRNNVKIEETPHSYKILGELQLYLLIAIYQSDNYSCAKTMQEHLKSKINRTVTVGALYVTLLRMIDKQLITVKNQNGVIRKYYSLTDKGLAVLNKTLVNMANLLNKDADLIKLPAFINNKH